MTHLRSPLRSLLKSPLRSLKSILHVSVCLAISFTAQINVQAKPSPMESLINPQNVRITGVKSFDLDLVKRLLFEDLEVMRRSAPNKSQFKYVDTLRSRLRAGFWRSGFVDCDVKAHSNFSNDQLTLVVTEGARYLRVPLMIEGGSDDLLARLKATPSYAELWPVGQPVVYDDPLPNSYEEAAQRAFAEMGYFKSDLELSFHLDRKQHTASLVITVNDLGPKSTLREIKIEGERVAEVHHAMILDLFQLKSGQPLNATLLDEAIERLRSSGRFREVKFETEVQAEGGEPFGTPRRKPGGFSLTASYAQPLITKRPYAPFLQGILGIDP